MKLALISLFCAVALSCKEAPKEMKTKAEAPEVATTVMVGASSVNIRKVFETHGGLEAWKSKRTLSFTIPKSNAPETHTIDLYSRNEKIKTPEFAMGFDGKDFWLVDENDNYKGDPIFYHNLMFYFYSMPFVLADNGIMYADAEPLEFEGTSYPGIRISYKAGVGLSSKDEYYMHYNPKTFQMEWLGYTVTYRSGEKSDNIKWIRYNDWMTVDELMLPKSLTWYDYEGRIIQAPRKPLHFENVTLSASSQSADFFNTPEGAKILQ